VRTLVTLFLAVWIGLAPAAARAQLSLIRDAEIEHILRTFATPIFQVAGVSPRAVDIRLVNDRRINAFVAGGQNLFLFTGLLVETETAGELIGVIAHETGHIAGGHIARGQEALEQAQRTALLTTLLGVAAAIASGDARVGAATAGGGTAIAERSFLGYSRSMESAADQAAINYLNRAGLSARGLLRFMETLEDQELLPASRQVEYIRTHPLTRDRVDFIRNHVHGSRLADAPLPPTYVEQFERMQAKLIGFLHPTIALRRYGADDPRVAPRYGHAIALYRQGRVEESLTMMTRLVEEEPNNPYFHEIVGQILLENGRVAEARRAYERAAALSPDEPLILTALAQTKIDAGTPADLQSAIDDLTRAVAQRDGGTPLAWRLLATAYGRTGDLGMSALALAEEALAMGDEETAQQQAARALRALPNGSSGWLRAQDIRRTAEVE
jgi:predicted Zn-dependent protease